MHMQQQIRQELRKASGGMKITELIVNLVERNLDTPASNLLTVINKTLPKMDDVGILEYDSGMTFKDDNGIIMHRVKEFIYFKSK